MPEYDLGTAHGRVRIDSDTRGADKAENSVGRFARAIGDIASKLSGFQRAMDRMERELDAVTHDLHQADRAVNDFEREMSGAQRTTVSWTRDLRDLHERVRGISEAASTYGPAAVQITRFFRAYRASAHDISFAEQKLSKFFATVEGGDFALAGLGKLITYNDNAFLRFGRTFSRVGGFSLILDMIKSRFLGMGKAMQSVTGVQRTLLQRASAFRTFTFAATAVGVFARNTGIATKGISALTNAVAPFDHLLRNVYPRLKKVTDGFLGVYKGADQMAGGLIKAIGGIALMRTNLRALSQRFAFISKLPLKFKAAIVAAFTGTPALIEASAKALTFVSNAIVLVWNALKTLSGGFLAIPGVVAIAVTAIGGLKLMLSGMKDAFKDVFKAKTPEEVNAAIEAMPEHLRGLGRALADIIPLWKKLQTDSQTILVRGADEQLRKLSGKYLPAIRGEVYGLAEAWVTARNRIFEFLTETRTVEDVRTIIHNTSETIRTLAQSIEPVGRGFRDLAVVGTEFIKNLAPGVAGVTASFEAWTRINRENGNLMGWMQDAWEGAKDLTNGILDAVDATYTLLTLFKTDTGENALERFAVLMDRFKKSVESSADGGMLKTFADQVRGLGTERIQAMVEVFKALFGLIQDMLPILQSMSREFERVMVPAIKLATTVMGELLKVLDEFGVGTILGHVLAMVAAFKLLALVLGPIKNLALIVVGAFAGFKGTQALILGAAGAFEKFGVRGKKASDAIMGIGDRVAGVISKVTMVAAIVGAIFYTLNAASDGAHRKMADFKAVTGDVTESVHGFAKAFKEANNVMGEAVIDEAIAQWQKFNQEVNTAAEDNVGVMDRIGVRWDNFLSTFSNLGNLDVSGPFGNVQTQATTDQISSMEKAQAAAAALRDKLKELGITEDQAARAITGTDAEYQAFIQTIGATGDALTGLNTQRAAFEHVKETMEKAGPGAAKLSEAISKLGDNSATAADKVNSLEQALKAAGLIDADAEQALSDYNRLIDELGQKASDMAANADVMGNALIDNAGKVDTNSNAGRELLDILTQVRQQTAATAIANGNAGAAWDQSRTAILNVLGALNITGQAAEDLVNQYLLDKHTFEVVYTSTGGDKVKADLVNTYAEIQARKKRGDNLIDFPIQVTSDPQQLREALEKIGVQVGEFDAATQTIKVTIPDPAKLQKAVEDIQHGLDQQPPPAVAPTVVGPAVQAPMSPPPPMPGISTAPVPQQPAAAPPPPPPPAPPPEPVKVAPAPGDQAELDKAAQTIADLRKQIEDLGKAPPPEVKVDTATLPDVKAKLEEIAHLFKDGKVEFTIVALGYKETQGVVNDVTKTVTALIDEVNKIPQAFQTAFDAAQSTLSSFALTMTSSGTKMMEDMAQGIRDGTHLVIEAANDMLTELKLRTKPGSPPKKGPLSGRNYTSYSGKKIAEDFGAGIAAGSPAVTSAANYVAGAARGPFAGHMGAYDIGKAIGSTQRLIQFGQQIKDVFDKVAENIFTMLKFVSDPLGEGTFFGKSTGAAFGFKRSTSREELQKQRNDELKKTIGADVDRDPLGSDIGGPGARRRRRDDSDSGDIGPSKDDIAEAIAQEAFDRGYDRNTAIGAIAAAMLESGLDPTVVNASGHESLFQTSADKGVGTDPADQIKWFFDTMDDLGGPSAVGSDPLSFIADNIEKGGYSGDALSQFTTDAADIVDAMRDNTRSTRDDTRATRDDTRTTRDRRRRNRDPEDLPSDLSVSGREGLQPAAENLLEVIAREFPEISRVGGVRDDSLPYHPSGRALDIMIPGEGGLNDPTSAAGLELGDRIYDFLMDNAEQLGIDKSGTLWQQLDHYNHIHAQVLDNIKDFSDAVSDSSDGLRGDRDRPSRDERILQDLKDQNPLLTEAIRAGQDPNSTDEQIVSSLNTIQTIIDAQGKDNTEQVDALNSIKSGIMGDQGFAEGANPIDQAQQLFGAASSIAGDIFQVMQSGMEAISATKTLTDMMIRYPTNTEDIMTMIDSFQKFIKLGADIAGAASSITSAIGAIAGASGGMDMGASSAISAVGQIFGLVQSALEATNAIIDLGQEAWHIFGSYFGQFLGDLAGGLGGQLMGQVKFLLDENAGQLYTYSGDNPYDKRGHNVPGEIYNPNAGQQGIGQINVYGGPGSDPRDNTRQMLYQIKAAGYAGATKQ